MFVALNHRILPKLYGGILAQYQNSMYVGGSIDGQSDNFYLVGLNLRYQFNPNFSAEVGYNYDNLSGRAACIMTETGFTSVSPAAINLIY